MDEVFVPYIPQSGPSLRDLSLNPEWKPFVNAFNTWMEQAQSVKKSGDEAFFSRIGSVIFFTGKVKNGERVTCPKPVHDFVLGTVLFSSEGFITNVGEDIAISASYITKE